MLIVYSCIPCYQVSVQMFCHCHDDISADVNSGIYSVYNIIASWVKYHELKSNLN